MKKGNGHDVFHCWRKGATKERTAVGCDVEMGRAKDRQARNRGGIGRIVGSFKT